MDKMVLAHWHQRIESFAFSTHGFYQRLQAKIREKQYPEMNFYTVQEHEGGPFTPKRDYLRVARQGLNFDVCAAPFGVDFFVSWWLLEKPGCGCLFLLGPLAPFFARKTTYYQEDTAIIFREAVHAAVVDVLKDILGDEAGATIAKFVPPTVAKSPLV